VTYRGIERWAYQQSLNTGRPVYLTGEEMISLGVHRQAQGLKGWAPSMNSDTLHPLPAAMRRMHAQARREDK
jgi:hypothetical protein